MNILISLRLEIELFEHQEYEIIKFMKIIAVSK